MISLHDSVIHGTRSCIFGGYQIQDVGGVRHKMVLLGPIFAATVYAGATLIGR